MIGIYDFICANWIGLFFYFVVGRYGFRYWNRLMRSLADYALRS